MAILEGLIYIIHGDSHGDERLFGVVTAIHHVWRSYLRLLVALSSIVFVAAPTRRRD